MGTPQELRKIRLKNDYKQMQNIKGSIISWKILTGEPPYVEAYDLTINVTSIINSKPEYRNSHVIHVSLPGTYPNAPPQTIMISKPTVFHPNWWSHGNWCYGSWDIAEGLGCFVIRMTRTLQFDLDITNPNSPANLEAKYWYNQNLGKRLFPCDHQILPDPTKSKFEVQSVIRKKFIPMSG